MLKKRHAFVLLGLLLSSIAAADIQVGIGIGLPNASIGINLPAYPNLVPIPGYPVYYAPQLQANFFFYDGMYWIYQYDTWYASSWYNGPWWPVSPEQVPLYILRIPVQYYLQPPSYFIGWQPYAPPRWGERWGRDWEHNRQGWDRWDRRTTPAPAPLPAYQRQYSRDRYPQQWQQQQLQQQHYRYQPHDPAVQQRYQEVQRAPEGYRQPNVQYQQNVMPIPQSRPQGQQGREPRREEEQRVPEGYRQPNTRQQNVMPAPQPQRVPEGYRQQNIQQQQNVMPVPQPRPQGQQGREPRHEEDQQRGREQDPHRDRND